MPHTITVSANDDPSFAELIHALLRAFNTEHSAPHRASREPGGVVPLNVVLRGEGGDIAGGLTGRTYWDWLEVEHLYVSPELRGQGAGSAILAAAETEAIARGARHAFLTTYEFQARAFYEKRGYVIAGRLDGYPPGSTYYWLRKELAGTSA